MGRGNNTSQEGPLDKQPASPLQFPRMPSLSSASDHNNNNINRRRHLPPSTPTATPISFSALDIIRHVKHRPTSSNWPINSVEFRQEENSYLFWLRESKKESASPVSVANNVRTSPHNFFPPYFFTKQKNLVILSNHFLPTAAVCSYKYFIYIYEPEK